MSRPKLGKVVFYRRVFPAWIPILDKHIDELSKTGEQFDVIFPDKTKTTVPRSYPVEDFGPANVEPSFLTTAKEKLKQAALKNTSSLAALRINKAQILKPSQKK